MWHLSIQTNNCSEYRVRAENCYGIENTWIRVDNDTLLYFNNGDDYCSKSNGSVSLDRSKCNIFSNFALSYDTNAASPISQGHLFIVLILLLFLGQRYL